jgi:endo-1,4-beta-D-glucanase Y
MLLLVIAKMIKSKKYFFYYLKENILVFDVSYYIDELAVHVIDFFYEWDLLKNKEDIMVIANNPKLVKELLETKIKKELEEFKKIANINNCKILSFFSINAEPKEWKNYFLDPLKFIKICKRICKKNLPNFFETNVNQNLFLKRKGYFLNFSCIIPNGDDEEFLTKIINKLQK